MRGIAVLGSTGTIGTYTLDIVRKFPELFHVVSLAAGSNVEALRAQILEFHPKVVSLNHLEGVKTLRSEFPTIEIGYSDEGVKACIENPDVDVVINGIVGFQALVPTLFAIQAGKHIGLANKESLVVAGPLFKKFLSQSKATIIPVDSEHNAIFQLLKNQSREDIESIVLTASGGPFFRQTTLDLSQVTPEMAVKHPNWNMGPKISVDSATLMNKGLELIEAHFLFGYPEEKIEVWIHPQSIVHGAVWFSDNTSIAQLSRPDMKSAIGYALSYPTRIPGVIPKMGFKEMARLEFFAPDETRFPCLSLARQALRSGHSHLVALNAVNEVAVAAFLERKILFTEIPVLIEKCLESHEPQKLSNLEEIIELDKQSRQLALETCLTNSKTLLASISQTAGPSPETLQ